MGGDAGKYFLFVFNIAVNKLLNVVNKNIIIFPIKVIYAQKGGKYKIV